MGYARVELTGTRFLLFWPVGSYEIIYRTSQDRVEIVAIVHAARDIPAFVRKRQL